MSALVSLLAALGYAELASAVPAALLHLCLCDHPWDLRVGRGMSGRFEPSTGTAWSAEGTERTGQPVT